MYYVPRKKSDLCVGRQNRKDWRRDSAMTRVERIRCKPEHYLAAHAYNELDARIATFRPLYVSCGTEDVGVPRGGRLSRDSPCAIVRRSHQAGVAELGPSHRL